MAGLSVSLQEYVRVNTQKSEMDGLRRAICEQIVQNPDFWETENSEATKQEVRRLPETEGSSPLSASQVGSRSSRHGENLTPESSVSRQQSVVPSVSSNQDKHGCDEKQFLTLDSLVRHQGEKSGTTTKPNYYRCGTEFTPERLRQTKRKLGEDGDRPELDYKRRKEDSSQGWPIEFNEEQLLLKQTSRRSQQDLPPLADSIRTRYHQFLERCGDRGVEDRLPSSDISDRFKKELGKRVTALTLGTRFRRMKRAHSISTSGRQKEEQFLWELTEEKGLPLTEISCQFEKEFGKSITRNALVDRLKLIWTRRTWDLEQVLESAVLAEDNADLSECGEGWGIYTHTARRVNAGNAGPYKSAREARR
ncbi:MAG: hypothetical protein Q9196_001758 [Gyalolechia fulgens]